MTVIGMKVDCYKPNMEDINCTGEVVGISTDTDGDAVFVVLKDDNCFEQCFVGYCKKKS